MELNTERLVMKTASTKDASFYFELFKDPDFIRFINDKNVNSIEETAALIKEKLLPKSFNGQGLITVFEKETNTPVGMSTLIKRDKIDFPDVGYAFLPKGRGKGYATEATKNLMNYVNDQLKLTKVYAFTLPDNTISQKLLTKLGFKFIGLEEIYEGELDHKYEYLF